MNLGTGGAAGSDTVVNIGSATPGADGVTVVNTPTVTFANGVTVVGMPQANLTALLLGLGGAVADAWNRLSVNTPAVLLNNAGSSIEATVNKAAAGNDASFAFKTVFSARALIGLLGSDDFSFKVSPDGSAYFDAILIDRNSGRVELPKPAVLPAATLMRGYPVCKKPTDAIHLATAFYLNVDVMHTYDVSDLIGLSGKLRKPNGDALIIAEAAPIPLPPAPLLEWENKGQQ